MLTESEQDLLILFENAGVGIARVGVDGFFKRVNRQMVEIFGYSPEEFLKFNFRDITHAEDLAKSIGWVKGIVSGSLENIKSEKRYIHKNGHVIHVNLTAKPVRDASGAVTHFVSVFEDISERLRREDLIQQQQLSLMSASKLATIGEMGLTLAHEINNPLAIIHGNASILERLIERKELTEAHVMNAVTRINETVLRISAIVKGLRAFARDAAQDPFKKITVRQIVDDAVNLVCEKFREHSIKLVIAPIDDELTVECRDVQIVQVLLNLLSNAHDAVLGSPVRQVDIAAALEGHSVLISVTDSGPGISSEVRDKIMQPFFTTKEAGKGTGLGLSISNGIIVSHYGNFYLDAHSKNTCFKVQLPITQNTKC